MYSLFSKMQDERLPLDFQAKVMEKIQKEAVLRRKRTKRWEIFGYVSGAVAIPAVCAVLLHLFGISFEIPKFELFADGFPRPDFSLFRSQSFLFSAYIGALAFVLLVVDSTIRRHIEKTK
ncbi:MAG: hypothetical protein LBH77_00850, partial [Tannerella sp.]|nr:hypothetical protein [Tannerella sp.]